MDFQLPEEHRQLKSLARRFVEKEMAPLEKDVEERGELPEEVRLALKKKARELGLWGYSVPQEYGGGGLGLLSAVVVYEELGRLSQALGWADAIIGGLYERIFRPLAKYERHRHKYYLPAAMGESDAFIALTEPNAGADAGAIEMRAIRQGENYLLNGTKIFITAPDRADYGMVFAVTDWEKRARGGVSCFIVERGTPGFSVTRLIPLMGRRGLSNCELRFSDCPVPSQNLVGEEGEGFRIAMASLADARVLLAAYCIGGAERALELAKGYAKQRATFGKLLAQRQAVQQMLVESAIDIHASRLMAYEVAWGVDQGMEARGVSLKAAMVKVFASEMACRAADRAIQIHGGYGYSKDLPLEMIYRDLRLFRIAEGPTEMLNWWMAGQILDTRLE